MRRKIIQVPVEAELLEKLDELSRTRGQSRSALIREASAKYITDLAEAEAVRAYIESYTNHPEEDDGDWRERNAAEVWGDEDWSEEYAQWLAEQHAPR